MPTATTNRHGSVVVEYDEYPQAPHRRGLHPHRMRPARRLIDIGWFECYDLHWGKEPLQAKGGVVGPVRRGQESDELPQRLPCRGQGRLHSGHARAYAGVARNASFERIERPFFPAYDDIPCLQPTILQ
ncbi:MAG: hypothetical protein VX911_00845 [Candidatus Latescibacterota bacterium]|nr:hypothetical protein [Candidatus Latescibacterota bacterium]